MNMIESLERRLKGKGCVLLYAAEAGSRAWGFASPDSDYDLRFIFTHTERAYLNLHPPAEQIDYKEGMGDVSGWDIRKACLLAHKSNPSLIEWLKSPTVYADRTLPPFREDFLGIIEAHHSPRALAHHYINFMRNIRGKYLEAWKGEYTLKRYFYALRPIFVIKWMLDNPGKLPPVRFDDLMYLCPSDIKPAVKDLLELKKQSAESMNGASVPGIDKYISKWYDEGHKTADTFPAPQVPIEPFNKFFYENLPLG